MSFSKQPNQRTDNRLDVCLKVEVTFSDGRRLSYCTKNMSTTGLFLNRGDNDLPEADSIVHVEVSSELGLPDAPLVKARVVRVTEEGFAIVFLSP